MERARCERRAFAARSGPCADESSVRASAPVTIAGRRPTTPRRIRSSRSTAASRWTRWPRAPASGRSTPAAAPVSISPRSRGRGHRAVGLDFSRGMLRVAARKVPRAGLVQANLDQGLPVRRGAFDVVLSALVSEHLSDLARFFAESFAVPPARRPARVLGLPPGARARRRRGQLRARRHRVSPRRRALQASPTI